MAGKRYEGEKGIASGDTLLSSNAATLRSSNNKVSFTVTTQTAPTPTQPAPAPTEKATFTGNVTGTDKADIAIGDDLRNVMKGGAGDDTLKGAGGDDRIDGGSGHDQLWGGTGNDQFVFSSVRGANGDQVKDFAKGDVFSLSVIDALNSVRGDQAFKFVDTADFTGAGQIRFEQDKASGVTPIEGNTDSDTAPEFTIDLAGLHSLTAADFVL